jgi:hypothetical protein
MSHLESTEKQLHFLQLFYIALKIFNQWDWFARIAVKIISQSRILKINGDPMAALHMSLIFIYYYCRWKPADYGQSIRGKATLED